MLQHECQLHVCSSAQERLNLLAAVRREEISGTSKLLATLSLINAEKAEATKMEDKGRISAEIERSVKGGFHGLNSEVKGALRLAVKMKLQLAVQDPAAKADAYLFFGFVVRGIVRNRKRERREEERGRKERKEEKERDEREKRGERREVSQIHIHLCTT